MQDCRERGLFTIDLETSTRQTALNEGAQDDERDTYHALSRSLCEEHGIAYGGRPLGQRNPHSSRRTGKPSTWRKGAGDRGVLKPGEYSVDTEQGRYGPIPNAPRNALSGVAELCRGLWRAGYIAKDVRPVRGGATGDRWLRDLTAPVVYSTRFGYT